MAKGTVHIDTERCKGCQLCIHACPQHVLHLSSIPNARGYCPSRLTRPLHLALGAPFAHSSALILCSPSTVSRCLSDERPSPEAPNDKRIMERQRSHR